MTLAEKLRQEGEIKGEKKGKIEGLNDAIELGMVLKFPDHKSLVMEAVAGIQDLDILKNIQEAIKTAQDVSEILLMLKRA